MVAEPAYIGDIVDKAEVSHSDNDGSAPQLIIHSRYWGLDTQFAIDDVIYPTSVDSQGRVIIRGPFNAEELKALASVLNVGAYPVGVTVIKLWGTG